MSVTTLCISTPAASASVPQTKACASASMANTVLNGSDLPFLKTFVPCVTADTRASRDGALKVNATLSQDATQDLAADHRAAASTQKTALNNQGKHAATEVCHGHTDHQAILWMDSSPPPKFTPYVIAGELLEFIKGSAWMSAQTTQFGFGYAKSAEFGDKAETNPVAFMLIAVQCS